MNLAQALAACDGCIARIEAKGGPRSTEQYRRFDLERRKVAAMYDEAASNGNLGLFPALFAGVGLLTTAVGSFFVLREIERTIPKLADKTVQSINLAQKLLLGFGAFYLYREITRR